MRFVFLAWRPTTPHHMLSSRAGRYYARILSWRQFEYLLCAEILCRFSSFIWIIRHASFILWISFSCSFHAHCCCWIDSWVARGCYHPSPHINNPSWDGFLCANFVLGTIRISFSGILCCFRFLSNVGDTRPLWFVLNFVFMDFSQSHGCVDKIYGCAGSHVQWCKLHLKLG